MAEISRMDVEAAVPKAPDAPAGNNPPANPNDPFAGRQPAAAPAEPQQPAQAPQQTQTPPDDEYRYPDDETIPQQMRGKTAKEAALLFSTTWNAAQAMAQRFQQQPAQPAQPSQDEAPKPLFDKDEFVTGDPTQIEQKMNTLFERRATPLIHDIYRGMTLQTMQYVGMDKANFPHYDRFKQEVLQELSTTPINLTADLMTWRRAYDAVVGRHAHELASLTNNNNPAKPEPPVTERGNRPQNPGGGADELTPEQKQVADGLGVPHAIFAAMAKLYEAAEAS